MSALIDLSSLTLNEQEALVMSEAVFEKVYTKPELDRVHPLVTGIIMKTQIPFYGLLATPVGKKDPGNCSVNAETRQISTSQKYWDPETISFRLTHCQVEMNNLFKMWKRAKVALKQWEEIDNEQLAFMADRVIDATVSSILRLSSFGDEAAAAAPGGLITAGVSTTYFTPLNGLWQQIYTGVAATTVVRVAISENTAASYVAQDSLASDRAHKIFKAMWEGADSRLLETQGLQFQVTRTLRDNWIAYLEDKSLGFTLGTAEERDGTGKFSYRGIPIITRYDWDRNIRAYEDNGTTWNKPHRAILTVPDNIPIGTSDEESFSEFDMFYDKKDKVHYSDVAYRLDCKLLEEYMITVAY